MIHISAVIDLQGQGAGEISTENTENRVGIDAAILVDKLQLARTAGYRIDESANLTDIIKSDLYSSHSISSFLCVVQYITL